LKLGELPEAELGRKLREGTLHFRSGPFVFAVRSRLSALARGMALLYRDFPLVDGDFADFHVAVTRPHNLRRWIQPQGLFSLGGFARFDPFPLPMALVYFEWGLNWCISHQCHTLLAAHAATVERDGKALLVVGPTGSGKSTLAAALAVSGWRLLSDELALFSLDDGHLRPLARPISLKNESIDLIRSLAPKDVFGPAATGSIKGTICHLAPRSDWVERMNEPAVARWVVFPRYIPDAAPKLKPVSKARAMMHVAGNAFNYSLLGRRGFESLAHAIDHCECWTLTYGRLKEAIAQFDRPPFRQTSAAQTA